MIQLALGNFRADIPSASISALQAEFAEYHTFQVRNFLAPELLAFVLERLRPEDFKPKADGKIAVELAVHAKDNIGVQCLQLRMNDKDLAAFMHEVTGITPVKYFEGRVYRMSPGADHYDSWHDDIAEGRNLGVSINLSPVPYRGGTFIIRQRGSEQVLRPMPNLGPGDAIFFRIAEGLQHMVSKVEGTASKTAFAGWFHEAATFADNLRKLTATRATP